MDLPFISNLLQDAPVGFGFHDTGQWLQDVPYIEQLTSIAPLFFEKLSRKEWLALVVLIKQRYIKDGPAYNLFDDHYQQYINDHVIEDIYKKLYFYQDQSQCLDFSQLQQLMKLVVSASKCIEKIVLPINSMIEALEFSQLSVLTRIEQIESLQNLHYLELTKCPKFIDFSFITSLDQLLWLDLSGNEQLVSLDFFAGTNKLVFLQLLDTHLLDQPCVTEQLINLPYLKYLTITGTQQQISSLRKALPNCVINGISALQITPSLG